MTMLPIGNEFLKLSEKEVAPEDVVFHKFYTSKVERKQKSSKEDAISITGEDYLLSDDFSNLRICVIKENCSGFLFRFPGNFDIVACCRVVQRR